MMCICPFMSSADSKVECTDECALKVKNRGCAFHDITIHTEEIRNYLDNIYPCVYAISGNVSSLNNKKK